MQIRLLVVCLAAVISTPWIVSAQTPQPVAPVVPFSAPNIAIPAPSGAAELAILSFNADLPEVGDGDAISLRWASNGDSARIVACLDADPDAPCALSDAALSVAPSGSLTLNAPAQPGAYRYRLEVSADGAMTSAEVTVRVTCTHRSLAPRLSADAESCPRLARVSFGAHQAFEGGMMLWSNETGIISVFYDDGTVAFYEDTYEEGMPEAAADAPVGLITPVRGFGRLWTALGGAEESGLGWATAAEAGCDVARQPLDGRGRVTLLACPLDRVYQITSASPDAPATWVAVR